MHALTHTALAHWIVRMILVLSCAYLGAGASQPVAAAPLPPPDKALVYVPLPSDNALDRFDATGLPAFAQEEDAAGAYVLTGTDQEGLRRLTAAGLQHRILDADIAGATYYFVMVPPGRPQPDWAAFSTVLYGDAQRLIRATPAGAERLAEQGAEIARLSPEPIVVQRAQTARLAAPEAITPDPLVQGMIDQVTLAAVQGYDAQLSGETPVTVDGAPYTITTRYTGSGTPIAKATQFVGQHMQALGLNVEYHVWGSSGTPATYPNVIGQRSGSTNPNNIYIIGAHLDDVSYSGTAPGADDNASGSAATLIAADILSQYRWGCTLRFALWTGEEQGLLGSYAYAARAKTNGEAIKGYLNLDMLGYNGKSPRIVNLFYKATPAGSEQIANTFMDVVNAYDLDLVPIKYSSATGEYSDNASFWQQSYPAILAIEDDEGGDFTPYYHSSDDRLSTLDLDYFTTYVKAAVGTFVHMSGCLLTGALGGGITASHDGSAIAGASVAVTDTHSLAYSASTDGSGRYARTLPAATYRMTASAYGYLPQTFTDLELGTGGRTQDFALQAAPPVAPPVTTSVVGTGVHLAWTHVPPNMTYTVHRALDPYFTPVLQNQQKSLAFTEQLVHDDLTGTGNRFYAVVGKNAAGVAAPPDRVGVFRYSLQPGD